MEEKGLWTSEVVDLFDDLIDKPPPGLLVISGVALGGLFILLPKSPL